MDNNDKVMLQSTSILSEGYGLYARCVARDKYLSLGAKALYAYLVSFAGNSFSCYPGRALMLKELGINVKTYTKYLNELKDRNYIKVHPNKNKGKFDNNTYEIILNKNDIKEYEKPIEERKKEIEKDVKAKDHKEYDKKDSALASETLSIMSKLYQSNIGVVNGLVGEWIIEMSQTIDADLFKRAIEICTDKGCLNHGYLKGIVKKWLDKNIMTLEQLEAYKLQENTTTMKDVKKDVRGRKTKIKEESSVDDSEDEAARSELLRRIKELE